MLNINQQAKAKEDLINIWQYSYREHGELQADKYYDELIAVMDTIKYNPNIGVSCDHIRKGYRQYKINSHVIFYRQTKNTIRIVRVLHKSMNFAQHF